MFEKAEIRPAGISIDDPDSRELAARLVHLARQRSHGVGQGPRVLPQPLPGTHHNDIAGEMGKARRRRSPRHEIAPDREVRTSSSTSTSAWTRRRSYPDIVLPAASWYEKADLNLDRHALVHPSVVGAAVAPVWESKSDWDIFQGGGEGNERGAQEVTPPRF